MDISIDTEYIGRLASKIDQFTKVRKSVWCGRCPICGDSKRNKFKKRFYVFFDSSKHKFFCKCHNCSYSQEFSIFIKENYSDLYKEYMLDKFCNKNSRSKLRVSTKDIIKKVPKKVHCKGIDYSRLVRFNEISKDHPARIYTENRKIPLDMVYYCNKFSSFISGLGLHHYKIAYENAHEPRMIIPFYREDGLSTVFQARAFSKKEFLRYITIKEDDSESKIYGLERVKKDATVYCVEGPLDSLMISNCIAMSGISTQLPRGISDFVFVGDNEPRNTDVVKNMRKRLINGHKVVVFPDRLYYKDLNDMAVKGNMSQHDILTLINSNTYSGREGIMKLNQWSKL